ncbi:hypothetical protein EK904_010971 [Melospiza melodia maxima]|nr:hypothetical protein EK904_010971 [Melospiza melodia maxima]
MQGGKSGGASLAQHPHRGVSFSWDFRGHLDKLALKDGKAAKEIRAMLARKGTEGSQEKLADG